MDPRSVSRLVGSGSDPRAHSAKVRDLVLRGLGFRVLVLMFFGAGFRLILQELRISLGFRFGVW